jgi:gentisate 1,2-dioxygenase
MSSPKVFTQPAKSIPRRNFYLRLNDYNAAPLWEVLSDIVPLEPRTSCVPALWKYGELRPLLMESGSLITATEAERRVLVLENPGLKGSSQITSTLYAGLQLILPGEVARCHRHAASAMRFVVESDGAYTAVEGERTTMHPGDLILTPSWTFHDHGNLTSTPAVWLDCLDIPIVNFFETGFAQFYPEETQPVVRNEGDSQARYGANLMPLEYEARTLSSPVFTYPYARSREVLEQLYRNSPLHPCHGIKVQYINPARGGYPVPTMSAFIQFLPGRFTGGFYKATDATIFNVAEGAGSSRIGDKEFHWKKHDVFVVPSWCSASHHAVDDTVLFSFSDRAAQKSFGLWREEYEC